MGNAISRFVICICIAATITPLFAEETTAPLADYKPMLKLDNPFVVFFNATRLSKMIPCGCHALNLGGIDKEAAMLNAYRGAAKQTLLVDAGGFFREFTDEELRLQTWYLLQAMAAMKHQAINVAYTDYKHGIDSLKRVQKKFGLPFISANIYDSDTSAPVFEPYKVFTYRTDAGKEMRVGVVGVTAPSARASNPPDQPPPSAPSETSATAPSIHPGAGGPDPSGVGGGKDEALEFAMEETSGTLSETRYEVIDEVAAAAPIAGKLRKECQLLILLAYDGVPRTKRMAERLGVFDMIVAGDTYNKVPAEFVGPGGKTLLVTAEHEGRFIGKVELTFAAESTIAKREIDLLPVEQNIKVDPAFTKFIDMFTRDKGKLPPPRSRTAEKLYAGAGRCMKCHPNEFAQWKASKHARAMKSLLNKKMETTPDCVRCHTLEFRQPGGFLDMYVTPNLTNVQCETCHGPGQKHVEQENRIALLPADQRTSATRTIKMITRSGEQFCAKCHDERNDPNFKYELDLKLVDHSTSETSRTRALLPVHR